MNSEIEEVVAERVELMSGIVQGKRKVKPGTLPAEPSWWPQRADFLGLDDVGVVIKNERTLETVRVHEQRQCD